MLMKICQKSNFKVHLASRSDLGSQSSFVPGQKGSGMLGSQGASVTAGTNNISM